MRKKSVTPRGEGGFVVPTDVSETVLSYMVVADAWLGVVL